MAVLGAVIEPFVGPVIKTGGNTPLRCAVGAKLVGDDPSRHETSAFHQPDLEPLCRVLGPPVLKDFIQNDTVPIDVRPGPEWSTRDLHQDFIQMSDIAGAGPSAA